MPEDVATPPDRPRGEWWWSQIPGPLRTAAAILAFLAFALPLTLSVLDQASKLWPWALGLKTIVGLDPLPPQPHPQPTPTSAPTPTPSPVFEPPLRPVVPGVFEGYVYYEVGTDRNPTNDGQLKPLSGPMPDFWNILPGQKFKAITPVNIRANPNETNGWDNSGFNTVVGILSGGECIKVADGERRRYPVRAAASGGFLPMIRVTCG
jgi:hypothetical protein